jgi:hypothetical protein
MQQSSVEDLKKLLRNLVNARCGAMMLPIGSVAGRQQTLR